MLKDFDGDFSFGSWVFQSLLAYCGPVAVLLIQYRWWNVHDEVLSLVLSYIFLAVTEVGLAFLVSAISSDSASEGSLVWILPAGFEIVGLVLKIMSSKRYGWIIVLFTLPTWSFCWYSATMWWRRCRSRAAASVRAS